MPRRIRSSEKGRVFASRVANKALGVILESNRTKNHLPSDLIDFVVGVKGLRAVLYTSYVACPDLCFRLGDVINCLICKHLEALGRFGLSPCNRGSGR